MADRETETDGRTEREADTHKAGRIDTSRQEDRQMDGQRDETQTHKKGRSDTSR